MSLQGQITAINQQIVIRWPALQTVQADYLLVPGHNGLYYQGDQTHFTPPKTDIPKDADNLDAVIRHGANWNNTGMPNLTALYRLCCLTFHIYHGALGIGYMLNCCFDDNGDMWRRCVAAGPYTEGFEYDWRKDSEPPL